MADPDQQLEASVDYGSVAGYFVRVDVTLRPDSLYAPADASGMEPITGSIALSADEAIAFADVLRERAQRITR